METAEKYRGKGLAAAAVSAMADYIQSIGKSPVWACHCMNIASQKLAEKSGFVKTGECTVITLEK